MSLEAVKEAKILVHVIKGFNVPIRNSAKQDILSKFQGGGNNSRMPFNPNNTGMNPYGTRTAGPFPSSLNNMGGTFAGGTMMDNMRQSFAGSQMGFN